MVTFQLPLVVEDLICPFLHYFRTAGTWVEPLMFCKLDWQLPHMKESQRPWRDLNPQQWQASDSKSTTLTTWPQTPLSQGTENIIYIKKIWKFWKYFENNLKSPCKFLNISERVYNGWNPSVNSYHTVKFLPKSIYPKPKLDIFPFQNQA